MNITKVYELPFHKQLKIRVHSKKDRLTIDEIVKRVTDQKYSTFCFNDLEDEETELIKIRLERGFPEY